MMTSPRAQIKLLAVYGDHHKVGSKFDKPLRLVACRTTQRERSMPQKSAQLRRNARRYSAVGSTEWRGFMLPATIHRRWAREFLARAQEAPNRDRQVKYLRLAVSNSVCAKTLEAEAAAPEPPMDQPTSRG